MGKLQDVMANIQKELGKDSIAYAAQGIKPKGFYSTGSLKLDSKLNGGFPIGRMTEISGWEGMGKTTLALYAIADCQRQGKVAVFLDLEGTFDKEYAEILGVDTETLVYIPPTNGEQAISIAEKICKTGEVGILVLDSVATMLPIKQEQGDVGNANMGYHAKLVSEFCKRFVPIQYSFGIAILVINQFREKPGISYGSPTYSTGGNSLKYYSAVRLEISKSGSVYKNKEDEIIGEPRKVKIVKSKINKSANQIVMFDINYGEGIDQLSEVIDECVESNIIVKAGSWYSHDGVKIGQGKENVKTFLQDNPELFEQLKINILVLKSL